ncbi:NmrA family transcriptional regulator [Opitutaceae bacterium EW11]|nr:NmrA family transcriptional regulator [Opitutaceae bacterium EW11]
MNTMKTLVIGGTGKTGRRVAAKLKERGVPVRIGSRSSTPPFDWQNESGWSSALRDMQAVYIAYAPDIAVPGAVATLRRLVAAAKREKIQRLVLLSGRGEEEAQAAERVIQESGLEWTIVRASWFAQNFSEGFLLDLARAGEIVLPAGSVGEPFVDTDDIADVAVAALTEDRHVGQLYEVTGPRLLTFSEAVAEIARAAGRDIRYVQVPAEAFSAAMLQQGVPADVIWLLDYLFNTVLDGRNASVTDGVQRALGRAPRDFAEYARQTAATGVWSVAT